MVAMPWLPELVEMVWNPVLESISIAVYVTSSRVAH